LNSTDPLIYDVACNLAEMHMDDVGLQVRSSFPRLLSQSKTNHGFNMILIYNALPL
jgi:hypothetical protein